MQAVRREPREGRVTGTLPFGWDKERRDLFERAKRKEGAHCGLCLRYIKVYDRSINSSMARWLIQLVRRYEIEPRWFGVSESWSKQINARDICLFKHWGMTLMKPKDASDGRKRTSGYWKPTSVGVAFARRECSVPCYKVLYNNELIFEKGPQVTIVHAIGKKFDHGELMSKGL